MPSKHTFNVSLTQQLGDFIADQIASGRFRTASEVIRAALRALERENLQLVQVRTDNVAAGLSVSQARTAPSYSDGDIETEST